MKPYKKIQLTSATGFVVGDIPAKLMTAALHILQTGEIPRRAKVLKRNYPRLLIKLTIDQQVFYIKVYRRQGAVNKFKSLFRQPEGVRALEYSILLNDKGIPAVRAPLAIVKRDWLYNPTSLVVTSRCDGIRLRQFIRQETSAKRRQLVLTRFARLFGDLLANKLYHGDASLDNFLVAHDTITLVDLDSLKRFPCMPKRLIFANLVRLNRVLIGQSRRCSKPNLERSDGKFIIEKVVHRFFSPGEIDSALQTIDRLTRR